jgi:hypothetical protein
MLIAMGAAKLIQILHPNSKVALRDLQTGHLTVLLATYQPADLGRIQDAERGK